MSPLTFLRAQLHHAPALADLVNSAYRGEASRLGWTTEADLLDGKRTDAEELTAALTDPAVLMVAGFEADRLVACVQVRLADREAQIGMLTVDPARQNRGVGRRLLGAAEDLAARTWAIERFAMFVIPRRAELLAYYQRRGYRRTGVLLPFPENPMLWQPKVTDLSLERLEKPV
ncbi:GNAT family N-acetyltransferase [Methylococcaceae bacterium WWC4]|nr:GNAT family N-acetyltransferase [Methylococcaceae bacterium WWC4]